MFEKHLDELPLSRLQILDYIRHNPYVSFRKLHQKFLGEIFGEYDEFAFKESLTFFAKCDYIRVTPYDSPEKDKLLNKLPANMPGYKKDASGDSCHYLITAKGAAIVEQHFLLMRQLESVEHIASEAKKQSDSAKSQAASASETANALREQIKHAEETAEDSKKEARCAKIISAVAIFATVLVPFIERILERSFP